ncbi:MAG: hypothetical protein ACPGXL_02800 [Chitinophagales bacterium]
MRNVEHLHTVKIGLCILFLSLIGNVNLAYAQQQTEQEKIHRIKHTYIVNALQLDTEQEKGFMSVYEAYEAALRDAATSIKKSEGVSQTDKSIAMQEAILKVRKEYNLKFKDVLSEEQIMNLFKAEKQFREMLRKKISESKSRR